MVSELPVDLFLDGGDGTPDRAFRALERTVARRRIRSIPAQAGVALRAGSIAVRVLSPAAAAAGAGARRTRTRGRWWRWSSVGGMRVFLSADAESEALLPLTLPPVDA